MADCSCWGHAPDCPAQALTDPTVAVKGTRLDYVQGLTIPTVTVEGTRLDYVQGLTIPTVIG